MIGWWWTGPCVVTTGCVWGVTPVSLPFKTNWLLGVQATPPPETWGNLAFYCNHCRYSPPSPKYLLLSGKKSIPPPAYAGGGLLISLSGFHSDGSTSATAGLLTQLDLCSWLTSWGTPSGRPASPPRRCRWSPLPVPVLDYDFLRVRVRIRLSLGKRWG